MTGKLQSHIRLMHYRSRIYIEQEIRAVNWIHIHLQNGVIWLSRNDLYLMWLLLLVFLLLGAELKIKFHISHILTLLTSNRHWVKQGNLTPPYLLDRYWREGGNLSIEKMFKINQITYIYDQFKIITTK
jgi:hypothetical protein